LFTSGAPRDHMLFHTRFTSGCFALRLSVRRWLTCGWPLVHCLIHLRCTCAALMVYMWFTCCLTLRSPLGHLSFSLWYTLCRMGFTCDHNCFTVGSPIAHCWLTVGLICASLTVHCWFTYGSPLVHLWASSGPPLAHWRFASAPLLFCTVVPLYGPPLIHRWLTLARLPGHLWATSGSRAAYLFITLLPSAHRWCTHGATLVCLRLTSSLIAARAWANFCLPMGGLCCTCG